MKERLASLFYPLPKYVKNFIKSDFEIIKYIILALFIGFSIGVNYWFNFEDSYVDVSDFNTRFFRYILFYSFAYFGGVIILIITDKKIGFHKKLSFWMMSILGIIIISFDGSYNGTYQIAKSFVDVNEYRYIGRLLAEFRNFITLFIPLSVIWLITKKKDDSLYGLTLKNAQVRPYFLLLLLMLPLILLATQDASFLRTYPLFKTYGVDTYWNVKSGFLALPFEFFYSLSFLNVELFFRGFLVIGMIRIMGKDAILPMVAIYAFLHFGKPMGEAISSVFGAYLLGIFAYYSRTIWGGVIVHGGIALLMELAAFWAKL